MSRVLSIAALLAAMSAAGPVTAADWGGSGDWGAEDDWTIGDEDLRGSYFNEPKDWAGLGDEDDPIAIETGLRYWYSWGSQSFAAGALSANDQSHIGEAHLRIEDHSSRAYIKAWAGYSMAVNGDYSGPLVTGTTSDGEIAYIGADLGWNAFGDDRGTGIGGLVGYMYWNNSPNTGRNNYTTLTSGSTVTYDTATGQTFIPGDSAPNHVDVNLIRLGVQGKANFGNFFDVSAEVAGVPYAKVGGTVGVDDPTFSVAAYGGAAQAPYGAVNGNISSMRSSVTSIDGWGYGAMGELWLGMHPTENLTVRLGGRAWYLQGTVDSTYTRAVITDPVDSDADTIYDTAPTVVNQGFIDTANPFKMLRYGLLAELTYSF